MAICEVCGNDYDKSFERLSDLGREASSIASSAQSTR